MERAHYAAELFLEGYNCAQAVCIAFCDKTGFTREQAAKMASAFGGGMGRMREVCGAVSGMYVVLSQLYGYDRPFTPMCRPWPPNSGSRPAASFAGRF